jgi:hypothetical protein
MLQLPVLQVTCKQQSLAGSGSVLLKACAGVGWGGARHAFIHSFMLHLWQKIPRG